MTLREAAEAVLKELDIIREHHPSGGPLIVHIDTHKDLRATLDAARATPAPALREAAQAVVESALTYSSEDMFGVYPVGLFGHIAALRAALAASAPVAEGLRQDLLAKAVYNEVTSGRWTGTVPRLRFVNETFAALLLREYARLASEVERGTGESS